MALRVRHLDGESLKVLAHPLRVRIVGSLRLEGPATATLLGQRLGASSGLTSYHVRVLAEEGFVEEVAGRGNGRERWWQAAQDMTSWRPESFRDDPDERAAEDWLVGFVARQNMERLDRWLDRRASADPAWVAASDASDYVLRLTPSELRHLMDELHDLVSRHLQPPATTTPHAGDDSAVPHEPGAPDDPVGRRGVESGDRAPVRLLMFAFPKLEPDGPDADSGT